MIPACPVCQSEIPREMIRRDGFLCPTCKQQLRIRGPSRLGFAVVIVLGFALSFVMGIRGVAFVLTGVLLSFFVGVLYGLMLGVSPKFERAQPERTYIILPPGSSGPRGKDGR